MTLSYLNIPRFVTHKGVELSEVELSYELAGRPLGEAPIVLVCHALTGNSSVAGPNGWWASLIGEGEAIDTNRYTILSFNIPGNCYDGRALYEFDTFDVRDVARLFVGGIEQLGIKELEVVIGASLGGGLVWQIGTIIPNRCRHLIPIASHYRANDWLLAQTEVQRLLLEGPAPLEHARIHGMLCYRTPRSLDHRFGGAKLEDGTPKVLDWLHYHGRVLSERFQLHAYRVMTYLTSSIAVAEDAQGLRPLRDKVHIVSIDSDLLFPHYLAVETAETMGASLHTIYSEHGHDAFLMAYDQLSKIIKEILA
ncbi:MAG: alpha/beta fold hydrolase [Bacteroidales bacterium]|uniref:alpha/beta fold hydrolase n=1 Tax=Porphyromonas sp. TaxID=1924944 RepID=UPI002975FC82|nr:alpha/beta fold hydrolase [Porphyromonas sp.]MDD7438346.1 alpha/beta fold hydrolase [Bacteroidales bacterium]MDY3066772.1 alpha/beta fold hydrolase [Porphyromonas sp.]